MVQAVSFFFSLAIVLFWYITRYWWLSNAIGVCLIIVSLKVFLINRMKPALLLLTLLFFYDIFWVFLSPKILNSD